MFKTKKKIIIAASIVASISVGLITYLSLILTGAINLVERNLVFTTGSDTIIYDGETTLTSHEYELVSGSLYYTHTMNVDFVSELDVIGETDNIIIVTIYDKDGNVVTDKYNIVIVYGILKIDQIPLKIATDSSTKQYDTKVLSSSGWNLLSGLLLEGHTLDVEVIGEITNAGSIENDFVLTIFDGKTDVTNLYNISKELGILEVTPIYISVETYGASQVYDGNILSNKAFKRFTDPLDGHTITVETKTEVVDVGVYDNEVSHHVVDSNNNDVSNNYEITLTAGVLEITPFIIDVTSGSSTKEYDGIVLFNDDDCVFTKVPLINGDEFISATAITQEVNAGEYLNEVELLIVDKEGKDVSHNYAPNESKLGVLTINQKVVVIETNNYTFIYDGNSYVIADLNNNTVTSDDFLEEWDYLFKGSVEDAGEYQNQCLIIFANSTNVDNYNIEYKYGTITILKQTIVVQTATADKAYDNTYFSYHEFYITINGVTTTYNYDSVEYNNGSFDTPYVKMSGFVSVIEIGIYYNTCTVELIVDKNYELSIVWGGLAITDEAKEYLYITPKLIQTSIATGIKNANEYYTTSTNLIGLEDLGSGYRYEAEIDGTLDVSKLGSALTRIISFTLYYNNIDIARLNTATGQIDSDDFRIQMLEGWIVATNIVVEAKMKNSESIIEFEYDGQSHSLDADSYTFNTKNIEPGYVVSVIGEITNVGTLKPFIKVEDKYGNDVTHLCIITNELATLKIVATNMHINIVDVILTSTDPFSHTQQLDIVINSIKYKVEVLIYNENIGSIGNMIIINKNNTKVTIYNESNTVISNNNFNITYDEKYIIYN